MKLKWFYVKVSAQVRAEDNQSLTFFGEKYYDKVQFANQL